MEVINVTSVSVFGNSYKSYVMFRGLKLKTSLMKVKSQGNE